VYHTETGPRGRGTLQQRSLANVKLPFGVLLLLLPAALVACSFGGGPYADLENPRHAVGGQAGRTCHYVQKPDVPSNLDALTRPGTRGSILLWGRDAAPSDRIDVSVRYGPEGRLTWTQTIATNVSPDRVAELERLLTQSLLEEGPADWGVRIRVEGGEVAAVLPSVICDAEVGQRLANPPRPILTRVEAQEAWQARTRPMEVQVGLDEIGRVIDVRLSRGSGSRVLDQYMIDLARAHRYHPQLHDGIGVPSVLAVPFRMPRF
jgi:hypothetical protein